MAFDKTVVGEQIEAILRKYSMEIVGCAAWAREMHFIGPFPDIKFTIP